MEENLLCSADELNRIPLIDKGLYDGADKCSEKHVNEGLKKVAGLKRLDVSGEQSECGKIVFLGLGASTPRQEFESFINKVELWESIVPINGCQGGRDINYMLTDINYWNNVQQFFDQSSPIVSKEQVQIIWLSTDDLNDRRDDISRVDVLREKYLRLIDLLIEQYPNLSMIFLQSRLTSAYTDREKHMEPKCYYNGLTVASIIDEHIKKGDYSKCWIDWSCYAWTNGDQPRAKDGFYLIKDDFVEDGVHLSEKGMEKVGQFMKHSFENHSVASKLSRSSV